jgi:hypothetical protein
MEIVENNELSRIMLDHIADMYGIKTKREGVHVSTLLYCLKKQQMDNGAEETRLVPTDQEVMLFALGWGLQDVMTPKSAETPTLVKDGITYRPDFVFALKDWVCELKTTRMSSTKGLMRQFPEGWVKYMKAGCLITERNTYDLTVLYILGNYKPPFPEIKSYRFTFTEEELRDNWTWILERKAIYDYAMSTGTIKLPPYTFNEAWECKNCRYALICDAESKALKLEKKIDENNDTSVG